MVFLRSVSRQLSRPASSLLSASTRTAPAARASFLRQSGGVRTLTATSNLQGKVLLVLYDGSQVYFLLSKAQLSSPSPSTRPVVFANLLFLYFHSIGPD